MGSKTTLDHLRLTKNSKLRLAIACQGGGSHGAYAAGFLAALLQNEPFWKHFQLVALSGTSAGAVNAALTWSGLTFPSPPQDRHGTAIRRLNAFWDDLSSRPWDLMANAMTLPWLQLPGVMEIPNPAAQFYTRQRMLELLRTHIRVGTVPDYDDDNDKIRLLIGASNIRSGDRVVFEQPAGSKEPPVDLAATVLRVLASAAVPPAFEDVQIGDAHFWDGLFTTNPPLRGLLTDSGKPDVVLIVRINPKARPSIPVSQSEKTDRRNEMAGNLALEQELAFIETMNDMVVAHGEGDLLFDRKLSSPGDKSYKFVLPYQTEALPSAMPFESKYEIRRSHIDDLRALGADEAGRTLDRLTSALIVAEYDFQHRRGDVLDSWDKEKDKNLAPVNDAD